jgi:hypothetical protein
MVIGRMRDVRAAVLAKAQAASPRRARLNELTRAARVYQDLIAAGELTHAQAERDLWALAAECQLDGDGVQRAISKGLGGQGRRGRLDQQSETVTRVRACPAGVPKQLSGPRRAWPRSSLVVVSAHDGSELRAAMLDLVADSVVVERLFCRGEPSDDLVAYVTKSRARVIPGASRRLHVHDFAAIGRLLRAGGYRRGDTIVTAGAARQIPALSEHWGQSRRPVGWSFVLAGLGRVRHGRYRAYRDAPRLRLGVVGDHVLPGWTKADDNPRDALGHRRRPDARHGPIIDALTLAGALAGKETPPDLATACALFGIDVPDLGMHPLDRLRAEAHAIAALYRAEMDFLDRLGLGLDASQLISTGGIASAMLREAGLTPLWQRMRLPDWLAGAAASAFFGPWSAAQVVHVPVPAVLADLSGTYARCASAVGIQRFLTARYVGWQRTTKKTRRILTAIATGKRALNRDAFAQLGPVLVRVIPEGHVMAVKPVRGGEARLVMAPFTNPDSVWRWATDVLAGETRDGGRLPHIVEAIRLVPHGIQSDLKPLRLPTGRTVDLATDDLALAMLDARAAIAAATTLLPSWQRDLLDGLLKRLAQTLFYGNLARVDREQHRTAVEDHALDPWGNQLAQHTDSPERPGPWCSLALAGMVTAAARLVVAHTMTELEAEGGSWLGCNVDSLLVAATHRDEAELVACTGGPVEIAGTHFLRALPLRTVEAILDRTDTLLCPSGGHAWKREVGFDQPMVGYVSGIYRYALIDLVTGQYHATEAALGGTYADPTGTNTRTTDGHCRWAIDAHIAVARAGITWNAHGPVPTLELPAWAERPALRIGRATTHDDIARLQRAFPERQIEPFTRYYQAVLDPLCERDVVVITLDVHLRPEQWLRADWRDQRTGASLTLTTDALAVDVHDERTTRVRTIRELLYAWRLPRDVTTHPIERTTHVLEPGMRQTVPVFSRAEMTEIVGKEGDDLLALLIDPAAVKGDQLTIYRAADTWTPILERARTLGAPELIRRGAPKSSAYNVLRGHHGASAQTQALIAMIVGETDSPNAPSTLWRPCKRPGCPNFVKTPKLWCKTGCKKAVQRAEETLALHARGAKQCRRCETIRYGDHEGPCPTCVSHTAAVVNAIACRYCGTLRVGDASGPCPLCGKAIP